MVQVNVRVRVHVHVHVLVIVRVPVHVHDLVIVRVPVRLCPYPENLLVFATHTALLLALTVFIGAVKFCSAFYCSQRILIFPT